MDPVVSVFVGIKSGRSEKERSIGFFTGSLSGLWSCISGSDRNLDGSAGGSCARGTHASGRKNDEVGRRTCRWYDRRDPGFLSDNMGGHKYSMDCIDGGGRGFTLSGPCKEKKQSVPDSFFAFSSGRGSLLPDFKRSPAYEGSYTIEAALLSGIWLFLILSLLMLFMGTMKKSVYTATACKAALAGSLEDVKVTGSGVDAALWRIQEGREHYRVEKNDKKILVSYRENLNIPYQRLSWKIQGKIESKIIKPVTFINRIRVLEKIKNEE